MLDKKEFSENICFAKGRIGIEVGDALLVIGLIEIRESIDRYIEQRIKSDKVIEGLLKDLDSSIRSLESKN